uniref:Regulator of microtubule dynamics protein 2 n=1 Tax=Ornithorhynchus anatinus TaxID=9258 RepID=A0A6I8N5F8_ORNAN
MVCTITFRGVDSRFFHFSYLTARDTESEEEKVPMNKIQIKEFDAFLNEVDTLHRKREIDRKDILKLLLENEEKFGEEVEFIWRLAQAYGDAVQNSSNTEEKKRWANIGKNVAEKAFQMAPTNGYCQLWYAVLCGHISELEGLQNKVHYAFLFQVAKLSWIEKKMAATIFESPPTSTIEEALINFLKAEEIKPGFSKMNYVFMAKCYRDLGQKSDALKYCDCALMLPNVNVEDKQAQLDLENVVHSLKNK